MSLTVCISIDIPYILYRLYKFLALPIQIRKGNPLYLILFNVKILNYYNFIRNYEIYFDSCDYLSVTLIFNDFLRKTPLLFK